MDWKYETRPDFKPETAKAYIRPQGSDDWQEFGSIGPAQVTTAGAEVRINIPLFRVLSRSGGAEVDITDKFDLENGITLTATFDTAEAADDFAHRWSKEGGQ